MRALAMGLVLLAAPLPILAGEASRFSGNGGLVAGDATSADGRYAMQADLKRGDPTQHGGRFSLDARLAASDAAKAASAACNAGADIFRNGFEQTGLLPGSGSVLPDPRGFEGARLRPITEPAARPGGAARGRSLAGKSAILRLSASLPCGYSHGSCPRTSPRTGRTGARPRFPGRARATAGRV